MSKSTVRSHTHTQKHTEKPQTHEPHTARVLDLCKANGAVHTSLPTVLRLVQDQAGPDRTYSTPTQTAAQNSLTYRNWWHIPDGWSPTTSSSYRGTDLKFKKRKEPRGEADKNQERPRQGWMKGQSMVKSSPVWLQGGEISVELYQPSVELWAFWRSTPHRLLLWGTECVSESTARSPGNYMQWHNSVLLNKKHNQLQLYTVGWHVILKAEYDKL